MTKPIEIPESEIHFTAIRAQGSGGQNVNKVSSAIHLRFDITASSLPELIKQRLLITRDHHISKDGIIIIKAQNHRTQEMNRRDAIERLHKLVATANISQKRRIPTKPSKNSKKKRLDKKTQRGNLKRLRGSVSDE